MRLSLRSVQHSDVLQSCLMITHPPSRTLFLACFWLGSIAYVCIVFFTSPPKGRKVLFPDHPLREGQAKRPSVAEHPKAEDGGHGREEARSCVDEAGGERAFQIDDSASWPHATVFFCFFLRGRFGEQNPCPRRCVCVVPRQPDGFQTL